MGDFRKASYTEPTTPPTATRKPGLTRMAPGDQLGAVVYGNSGVPVRDLPNWQDFTELIFLLSEVTARREDTASYLANAQAMLLGR